MNKSLHDFLLHLKIERNYSNKTIESYESDIEKFYRFLLKEDIKDDDIDFIVIRNFLTEELMSGVSKRSCKRRLCALKHYYRYRYKKGEINYNPFLYVSSPKTQPHYPTALYESQINQLLDANKTRTDSLMLRDQAILEILYYTGIRASELVNIKLSDINYRSRIIRIFGKGSKERIVPFTNDCLVTLEKYLKEIRPILAAKTVQISIFLFLNNHGEQLTTRGLEYILDSIDKKLEMLEKRLYERNRFKFTI